MLTKFQVEIYHREGQFAKESYVDEKFKRAGFWVKMKAQFSPDVEPFHFQFQQSVTTEAARVEMLKNNPQFMNTTWTPQSDYNNKEILKPGAPGTDYGKDMDGYRYFRQRDLWYKYNDTGLLKECEPDEKNHEIKTWDIWIEDEPGYEAYQDGDFVVYNFTGTCNLVMVQSGSKGYLQKPILIAKIGPYTAYWRGIWPYRKTNIPTNGLRLNWDQQLLTAKLAENEGYRDEFVEVYKPLQPK